eukprot:gene20453-40228_t
MTYPNTQLFIAGQWQDAAEGKTLAVFNPATGKEIGRYMHAFAQDIQSGTVKINRTTTGNLVNAPFGGIKNSSTSTF